MIQCAAALLKDLPQLTETKKAGLDHGLTLEELTAATGQLASGRAPGIDGLSAGLFKHFWELIGPA